MKELKPWLLLTIILYLFFLAWRFPADRTLSILLERRVIPPAMISIEDPAGSWSRGHAPQARIGNLEIKDLSWNFQPAALLLGNLQFAIAGEIMNNRTSCQLSFDSNTFTIKNLNGILSVDAATKPYLPGINLTGTLNIDSLYLTIEKGSLYSATGKISWQEAALGSPYNTALGGLALVLSTDESGVMIKVSDLGGPLQADGLAFLASTGDYSYNGSFGTRQGSSPDLASFLQILGSPQADGKIKVDLKGKIPRLF